MHMKSFLAISALSASTLMSAPLYADSDSNWLLGLDFGYARQKENFITGFTAPTLAPLAITTTNTQTYMISDQQLFLGILGGWQWRCNRVMLGLEGNVDFHTIGKAKPFAFAVSNAAGTLTDFFSSTVLYERGPIYALTTRAGYFATPAFMPYVRLGAQISRDEATYQTFASTGVNQQNDFVSSKKSIWGVVAGVGVEFPAMIGSSTLRFEYDFTRTESLVIDDTTAPIFGSDKFRDPQTNVLKISWVWNFL